MLRIAAALCLSLLAVALLGVFGWLNHWAVSSLQVDEPHYQNYLTAATCAFFALGALFSTALCGIKIHDLLTPGDE